LDAGRENAADVLTVRGEHVEVRRRSEVHDDAGRAVAVGGGDGVRDPVRADVARVVVEDRDAGPDPRFELEILGVDVTVGELRIRARELWNGRRDADAAHGAEV